MEPESVAIRKDAVVVLGMHRSGTSAMARVLSLAGAELPARLMPAGLGNPNGHWEPTDVQEFNDQVLNKLKSGWDDVFGPRRNKKGKIAINAYLPRAREIIRVNWPSSNFIVMKEPRVSLLMDLWNTALVQEGYRTSYVIMVRDPVEVAESLKSRYFLSSRNLFLKNRSYLLWATYMLAAETGTRDLPRMFVSFDDLVSDPGNVLDRAELELDLVFPSRSLTSGIEIEEFIRPEERHFTAKNRNNLLLFGPLNRYFNYLESAARGAAHNVDGSLELADWLRSLEHSVGPLLKQLELDRRAADEQIRLADQRIEAEHTAAEAQRAALEAELRTQLEGLASQSQAAQKQAAELQASLDALEAERAAREADLRLANERADAAEANHAAAEAQRAASEAELRAELDGLALQSRAAQQQAGELQASLVALEAERAARETDLTERFKQAEAETRLANERADAAQANHAAAEAQRAASEAELRAKLDRLASQLQAAQRELLAEREELERNRTSQIASLTSERRNSAERESALRAHMDAREAELVDEFLRAKDSVRSARVRIDELEAGLADQTLVLDRERAQASRAIERSDALEATLTIVRRQMAEQEAARRAEVVREQENTRATAIHQSERVTALQNELAGTSARRQELQHELARTSAALLESEAARNSIVAEAHELRAKEAEVSLLRDRSAELARSLSQAVSNRRTVDRLSAFQLLWEATKRIKF